MNPIVDRVVIANQLEVFLAPHGFEVAGAGAGGMGGWFKQFDSEEVIVLVGQDRSGEVVSISIGSKVRCRPKAQMRGPWSMGHLRGFIEGNCEHFLFHTFDDQLIWFKAHFDYLNDSTFLNSDLLKEWSVKASRLMFGG